MLSYRRLLLLASFASLMLCGGATVRADVYFPFDATINYDVMDYAIVGRDEMGNNFSPTVNLIMGGSVDQLLEVYNSSLVRMTGGSVGSGVQTNDSSTFIMSGGSVDGQVYALNNSKLDIRGGTISNGIQVQDNTKLTMSGGNVGLSLFASGTSITDLSGGSFGGDFYAFDSSTINFHGSNLTDVLNSMDDDFSSYTLHGTLQDGTSIDGKQLLVETGMGASFHLITTPAPEASSLVIVFLGLSGGGLYVLRQERSRKASFRGKKSKQGDRTLPM